MTTRPRNPSGEEQRFGAVLRRYRGLAGLSQEALAAAAGVSRRGIADLERGARNSPYPDTARRLADALRLGPADRDVFMAACRRDARDGIPRYSLPIDPSPIVGRRTELADLGGLAGTARLVTLTGPAGVGKTRLAIELARSTEHTYRDGALLVDLAPLSDDTLVPATVAATLGVLSSSPGRPAVERVREHLHSRELVLVLDNCEHLLTACAELVDVLLRDAAGVRILATSREPLRIHGEAVWVVPPLTAADAVALLTRQAHAAGAPAFTTEDAKVVSQVCARLEGLPLAIELTAAHIPALGVAQVAELLSDRLDFLQRGDRIAPPRHRTLRAALDWTFTLLDPVEQRVMTRLASFNGGWNLDSARDICGYGDLSGGAVVGALEGLVAKSVVVAEDSGGKRRFRFLETVREYAAEHLAAGADATVTRDRHARHFVDLARAGASWRLGRPVDVARLRLETANLRTALRWLLDGEQVAAGLELCQALGSFWLSQGFFHEGEGWYERFVDRAGGRPSRAVAAALYSWARLTEYRGDLDLALELLERSRAMSTAVDDATIWSRATCGLGDVMLHRSKYADAVELFESAAEAAESAGSKPEKAQAMLGLARAASLLGDPEQSRSWLEQAVAVERELGDRWGVAYALNELGLLARRAGRLDQALTLLEECHVLWRQTGTRMGERAALMNLTLVTLDLGRPDRAAEHARHILALSQEIGDAGSTASVRCLEIAAQCLGAMGAMESAIRLIAAASERRSQLGAPRPALEETEIVQLVTAGRRRLGEPAFQVSWSAGAAAPVRAALDLALEELM